MKIQQDLSATSSVRTVHRWWYELERGWQATILGLVLSLAALALA
jgi:hypothetical protein